jgi:hypothetical protein
MNLVNRSLRSLTSLLALGGAFLAGTGCSKEIPSGPFGSYLVAYPEGVRDTLERTPSDLVVWPDVQLLVALTRSDAPDDTSFVYRYRSAAGVMHGEIMDYVQASGYQLFRSEDGGGYRSFNDFWLSPERRFSDRSYYGGAQGALVMAPAQFFAFSDANPATIAARSYVARAQITGVTGSAYPLTNLGTTPDTTEIPTVNYTGRIGTPGNTLGIPVPPDSLLALSWDPVPGAAGYWVHIYQKRPGIRDLEEATELAQPSPIATGKVRDKFIGFFRPLTAFKLGDPVPPGARLLVYRVLIGLQEVFVRVSAVDASGRMIACTGTSGSKDKFSQRVGQVDFIYEFLANANFVTPDRPQPPTGRPR